VKKRKSQTEELKAVIYGIRRSDGEIARISAYKKGKSVRLSGPHDSKIVHPSNEGSIEGWSREAALVWGLSDVYNTHPLYEDAEYAKQRLEQLKTKSEQRKRELAENKAKQQGEAKQQGDEEGEKNKKR
jgi:hypothetical protein